MNYKIGDRLFVILQHSNRIQCGDILTIKNIYSSNKYVEYSEVPDLWYSGYMSNYTFPFQSIIVEDLCQHIAQQNKSSTIVKFTV